MNKIALLVVLLFGCLNSNLNAQAAYNIGDKAEDFKLQNVDGTMKTLSKIEDVKGYIIVFTSNECPFAKAYEDRLIELHNEMAPKGYPIVAINSNEGSADGGNSMIDMSKRHGEKEFPFLYLKDSEQKVYPKFGATKTPEVFLLDSEMVVRYKGAIDDSPREPEEVTVRYVAQAIDALENGNAPEPAVTKAIGCSIAKDDDKVVANGSPRGGNSSSVLQKHSPARLIDMMDLDNDNMISKSEAQGPLVKIFENLDADKDGKLTKEELGNN